MNDADVLLCLPRPKSKLWKSETFVLSGTLAVTLIFAKVEPSKKLGNHTYTCISMATGVPEHPSERRRTCLMCGDRLALDLWYKIRCKSPVRIH